VPKSACGRALFALNHIFDDGNEFPIKNYPKMTPITIHLRKKRVGMHENAHKCLKVLSACALFAPICIFDDGNEFPIKNYPKMTPITINLRKKV
jgi:hypothetical protein